MAKKIKIKVRKARPIKILTPRKKQIKIKIKK